MTTRVGSSSSSAAAAQAAAAAAAARAAEARRRAEAARKAAEAARKAAEAAKAAKAAATAAKRAEAAKKKPDPVVTAKLTKADTTAGANLQKAEEAVALKSKAARTAMEEANTAAVAEKLAKPFTPKDLKAVEATKLEVATAFDGSKRSAALATSFGVQAPSASDTQRQLDAERNFQALQRNPAHRAALDKLGVKNGGELIELGDRLERQLKTGERSPRNDAALKSVDDPKALNEVLTAAAETRTDDKVKATLEDPFFAERLQAGDSPRDARDAVDFKAEFKLSDRETTQFLSNTNARNGMKALFNPNSTPAQRASGLMQTIGSLNQALPPERVKETLQRIGGSSDLANKLNTNLGSLKGLTDAYATFTNPNASDAAKAKAALGVATSLKNIAGNEVFKELAPALRKLDGPARLVGAGLTLLDPNAKPEDKALAALTVAGEARGAWRDLSSLTQAFKDAKIPNPEALVKDAESLANRTLATLPDELTGKLTGSQVSELARAGSKVDLADLKPLLQKLDVTDPAGLDEVLKHVNGAATPEEAKRFLGAVNGLDPKVASQVLKDPVAAQKLADLAKKLPLDQTTDHLAGALKNAKSPDDVNKLLGALDGAAPADANKLAKTLKGLEPAQLSKLLANPVGLADLTKTLKSLDGEALDSFVKITKNMDASGIADMAKYASKAEGDVFQKLMKGAAPLLEKMDGRALGELANGLAKGFSAIGGLLGKMGVSLTADIAGKVLKNVAKMVPVLGAIPGFVDAALLTRQSFELKDKNADLSLLASNGAKLNAVDAVGGLILDATGVGVGVDLAVGVGFGIAELALDIGLSSERAKMEAAAKNGEDYEAPGWVKGINIASAVATAPLGVAEYIERKGPRGAFEDAKWAIGQGGKLADKAWDLIKAAGGKFVEFAAEAVEALKDLGEAGVEKLEELSKATGEFAAAAAEKAQDALKDLAKLPGEAAQKAAEAIARGVDAGAEWAKDAATELLKDGVEAMKDVAQAWAENMTDGARAVVDNLENLGEAGVDALKDLGSFGGELAEYTVGKLKNLAEDGLDAAKDALGTLADLGGSVGDLAGDVLGGLGGLAKKLPFI
ncbi:MAG: hypothetical protein Q8N23_18565 [Archangium sp.]|nr:hypothetical protein [Archangium sp.]MDP3154689.1 hypothetical protein [Archangium sp.]MDP3572683.1 hypothetical protein [Archangium sp.]